VEWDRRLIWAMSDSGIYLLSHRSLGKPAFALAARSPGFPLADVSRRSDGKSRCDVSVNRRKRLNQLILGPDRSVRSHRPPAPR